MRRLTSREGSGATGIHGPDATRRRAVPLARGRGAPATVRSRQQDERREVRLRTSFGLSFIPLSSRYLYACTLEATGSLGRIGAVSATPPARSRRAAR